MPTEDEVRAHSPFQVRLIETNVTADTEEMILVSSPADTKKPEVLHVQKARLLDHVYISSAAVMKQGDSNSTQFVVFLDETSRSFFADIKRQNAGRRIGIILDGKLMAAPQIETEKDEDRIVVACKLAPTDAAEIVKKIQGAVWLSNALGY
jgi:preprotein translocase subunit SecD